MTKVLCIYYEHDINKWLKILLILIFKSDVPFFIRL